MPGLLLVCPDEKLGKQQFLLTGVFMRYGAMLIALLGAIAAARNESWMLTLLLVLAGWQYLKHNRYGAAGDADDDDPPALLPQSPSSKGKPARAHCPSGSLYPALWPPWRLSRQPGAQAIPPAALKNFSEQACPLTAGLQNPQQHLFERKLFPE
jgi:hypothetical protein